MTNYDFLEQAYDSDKWKNLIRSLFPSNADLFARAERIEMDNERIESFTQFGTIRLNDQYDTQLALFEIRLRPNTTKLQINRVALNKIVAKINESALLTGALAVYVDDEKAKWRFSFIAKRQQYNQSGKLESWETEPKRYTYVFGTGEKTLTARQRFQKLEGNLHKRLEDIEEAFSVEKVSNEFFTHYKEQYDHFCTFLYTYPKAKAVFSKLVSEEIDFQERERRIKKLMDDFANKLLGRLVFLYFLQKKRWLGGEIGSNDWQDGKPDFIRQLFDRTHDKSRFYSQVLAPLYFRTLNSGEEERPGFAYEAPAKRPGETEKVKVPFLNGGLFEEDQEGTEQFDFPESLFKNLLDLFDRYNFTVDENSPNDHEVGIDPEMLGHIFENLLEENRSKKGAFYTPKEIVHYLCQESLYQYLKAKLLPKEKPAGIIWSDSRQSDESELETFVRYKLRGRKDGFIYKNARAIDKALRDVRICDPAIGSGAFPMGLLYEIFHCHVELDLTKDYGKLKREIIEHCIYGVDIDKGAVDIAQLRFWLALIVDETEPKPLPNLDYKIMQGDSLLERFEQVDLSQLMKGEELEKEPDRGPKPGTDLFNSSYQAALVFDKKEREKIEKLLHQYYQAQSKKTKKELAHKINQVVYDKVDYKLKKENEKLMFEKDEIDKNIERHIDLKKDPTLLQRNFAQKESEIVAYEEMRTRLFKYLTEPEKPFFLWHVFFEEVLQEHGGFDIVIGNPPYVQIQGRPDDYKNWLQLEGYKTFDKSSDLYVLFYERGWQILRKGGFLAFITSNKWMRTNYGERLRAFFLDETTPLKLIDFGMAQNFSNALTYTSIMIFQKGKSDRPIEICRAQADYSYGTDVNTYFKTHQTNIPDLDTGSWVAYTKEEHSIKKIVEEQGVQLNDQDFWKITINRGIVTGYNKAFYLKTEDKERILENERNLTHGGSPSEGLFKKMLRGEDVRAWAPEWSDWWLIGTFPSLELNISDYPGIEEHLKKYEHSLIPRPREHKGNWTGRKPGSYHWFETQDSIAYWKDFLKPKIIYPNMTKYLPFAYDETGFFTNQKCFIITGEHLKYLTIFFNSKLFKYCFRHNFPELLGETYELSKVFFDKIPVKKPSAGIEKKFDALTGYLTYLYTLIRNDGVDKSLFSMAEFFEYLSNGLVYEMYFGDQLKTAGRDILKHLPDLPLLSYPTGIRESLLWEIGALYRHLSDRNHPVTANLYYMTGVPEIRAIESLNMDSKV